jgi:hypothetical protein
MEDSLTPYRPIVCTFVLLGTVLLMPGRASAQDHHGKPTGPQGPAGPPGPGLNGRQEFQVTGPFIPGGVTCGTPAPGAGGAADPNAAISHSGPSAPSVFTPTNIGAGGYLVPGFAFQPNGQFGGGGAGAFFPPAQAGQGGYALLSW